MRRAVDRSGVVCAHLREDQGLTPRRVERVLGDDVFGFSDGDEEVAPRRPEVLAEVQHALELESGAATARLWRSPRARGEESRIEAVHGEDVALRGGGGEGLRALHDVVVVETEIVPEPHDDAGGGVRCHRAVLVRRGAADECGGVEPATRDGRVTSVGRRAFAGRAGHEQ